MIAAPKGSRLKTGADRYEANHLMLLAPELKTMILKFAFGKHVSTYYLIGKMGMLWKQLFGNESTTAFQTFVFDVSGGNLLSYHHMRSLSKALCVFYKPVRAMTHALSYLNQMFSASDDLELCLRDSGHLHDMRETPGGVIRSAINGWRDAKIFIYAAPRGNSKHTSGDIFRGVQYSFDFCNDILNPLGVESGCLAPIYSHKDHPFLAYRKTNRLLSSKEIGIYGCVCKVWKGSNEQSLHDPDSFVYRHNSNRYCSMITVYHATRRHLDDVWPTIP